jgi:8-amino-7-oxononanoate synthase
MFEFALEKKVAAALASREDRNTIVRLPNPPRTLGANSLVEFASGDYLSLSNTPLLRSRVLAALYAAPEILGSGGSCFSVYNHEHATLEARLARTFRYPAAFHFNSGFDANAGFFTCVPQRGDALL